MEQVSGAVIFLRDVTADVTVLLRVHSLLHRYIFYCAVT
jgi:hypothetical protein